MCCIIQFNFAIDKGPLKVLLEADVERDDRGIYYLVKNFRIPGHTASGILPEIRIKKIDGHWVHRDSGWQTELSEVVGEAIDKAMVAL
jgi:hypothetical protein